MKFFLLKSASMGVLIAVLTMNLALAVDDFASALQRLQTVESSPTGQIETQRAWGVVAKGNAAQLTEILTAMKNAGPLAENWLRAAFDAIAERKVRESGNLPTNVLEKFVLNTEHTPRARRTAFEWLAEVDPTISERLLPQMLEDTSLELRYDAVARLIAEASNAADNTVKLKIYQRAFAAARARDQMAECIKQLQKLGESPDLEKYFAYVTHWRIIGPFDNTTGMGMNYVYPPEEELAFNKEYEGKSRKVSWNAYRTEAKDLKDVGRVDLNEALVEEKGVVAYAAATLFSEIDQEVECRYETVNATKLWVNGKHLASDDIYHAGGEFDQYIVPVKLQRGKNTILLKICQNEQTETWARPWNFRLRITDQLGAGVDLDSEVKK